MRNNALQVVTVSVNITVGSYVSDSSQSCNYCLITTCKNFMLSFSSNIFVLPSAVMATSITDHLYLLHKQNRTVCNLKLVLLDYQRYTSQYPIAEQAYVNVHLDKAK